MFRDKRKSWPGWECGFKDEKCPMVTTGHLISLCWYNPSNFLKFWQSYDLLITPISFIVKGVTSFRKGYWCQVEMNICCHWSKMNICCHWSEKGHGLFRTNLVFESWWVPKKWWFLTLLKLLPRVLQLADFLCIPKGFKVQKVSI